MNPSLLNWEAPAARQTDLLPLKMCLLYSYCARVSVTQNRAEGTKTEMHRSIVTVRSSLQTFLSSAERYSVCVFQTAEIRRRAK